jgi:hypothetical protein
VLKSVGESKFCVSGKCDDLSGYDSCKLNKKCVYSKSVCTSNMCEELNQDKCAENVLCYIDDNNKCAFDLCSDGSGNNDNGISCLLLTGCEYEVYDDTCKVSKSKFTIINVGSILGIV